MGKKIEHAFPDKVANYDRLIASVPQIQRKGAGTPYTSVNGNMFSYLHSDGVMALRLPQVEREKFLSNYDSTLMQAYGIVQKEYVVVPGQLLESTDELRPYLEISFDYASKLKPKRTK
jgi:hypothetical protein